MRENIRLAEVISANVHEMRDKITELLADLQNIRDEWYTRYEPLIASDSEEEIACDARELHNLLIEAVNDMDIADGKLSECEIGLDSFVLMADECVL